MNASQMDADAIDRHGQALFDALVSGRPLAPIRLQEPGIGMADAYAIQLAMIKRRLARGETIIGKKIGVTSRPIQEQLGVFEPDFGQLTSGMQRTETQGVDLSALIQPRVEAEIAFVLDRDLVGPRVTATDVIRATAYVSPCFEIVDSRIRDWDIRIHDTVSDNASCGVFILGDARANLRDFDVTLAGMVIERNGELLSTSAGAAVQGSPVNAVVWLANKLGAVGLPFRAGEIILSGSQSTLIPVEDGDTLKCSIGGLGSCTARFFKG